MATSRRLAIFLGVFEKNPAPWALCAIGAHPIKRILAAPKVGIFLRALA